MTRLVLFDIDGTLIRTGGAGVLAFARTAANEFDCPNGTQHLKFAGRTDSSLVREFFEAHSIAATPENSQRFFDHYVFLLDHLLPQMRGGPCAGVTKFLHDLRRLPDRPVIGLLTGNVVLGAEIKLRHFGLWDVFEMGAFGDDHEDRNELAAIALARAGRLLGHQLQGHEALVVGDTPADIRCGRAIGARVLAVGTGGASIDELRLHQPDWLAPDLRQIEAAVVCGAGR